MTTTPTRRLWLRLAAAVWLMTLLPFAATVRSQGTTGTILGTLVDRTGGVLPGVKVVILRVDTAQQREVVTNEVGQYNVSLPIGNYEITFLLPDFQPFTARGIALHLNDRLQINATLRVGAIETLTVTAERLIQQTATVQTLIQRPAIQELPLLTRTPIQLVTLVPGVSSDLREDACFCDQGNLDISIHGARRSAVNWLLDGASNVNGWNNYTLVATPSLDAIQEINVMTSTYAAEWSRNGGGVVNTVTKSGSNRFSGSVYEFLRNDALNANSFFRNRDPRPAVNSSPPRLRYHNFGYTVGGPALPDKRNLFFFFSQEFRRSTRNKPLVQSTVPDPNWLIDPASPNYVPPEARDPNAVKLLALWPTPNVPGTNLYRAENTDALDTRQEFVRADYNISADWLFTGRYLQDRVDALGEYVTGPDRRPGHRYQTGRLAVAEVRHVGQRLLYESSYQLSSHLLSRDDFSQTRGDLDVLIPELFPENAAALIPNVTITGLSAVTGSQPRPREYINHTFGSALTLQYGTHVLKTGGLFAVEHINSNLIPETTHGSFVFQTGGGFTAFQNFLRGNAGGACGGACRYFETDIDVLNRFRTHRYELYVQDTWRIHPRVTLDLGLRYAFYQPLTDDGNRLFAFSPDAYDPAQAPTFADPAGDFVVVGTGNLFNGIRVAGQDSPYGRAIYAADKNNLQPRIGGAWDPSGAGRLIVRAGYGMYFDQTQVGMFTENVHASYYDPFRTDRFISNPPLSNPGGGTVVTPFAVVTPVALATSDQFVAPRWQHWNVGVQRRLYARGVIDLGYIGSRGDHLLRYVDINQPQPTDLLGHGPEPNRVRPFPGYDAIVMREPTARSRYDGLAVSFHHESTRGMWATLNYTWGLNQADATYDNSVFDDPQNPLQADAEFGPALTDRSHIFNVSYVYELPLALSATAGWQKALLGGWQVAGITRIESGPAARIQTIACNYGSSCFPGLLRPDQTGDPAAGEHSGLRWFDPEAFVLPAAGEYGDAPVAPFRLPGRHQWDFTVSKNIRVGGTKRLQVRADLINAFNHTQFLDVNTECRGTDTCRLTGGFGQVTSTRPAREIQLGVRFDW